MNKIILVIQREYYERVKKKSFIIMTLIGPVLMAALFVIPIWLSTMDGETIRKIAVIDESGTFKNRIEETETLKFDFNFSMQLDEAKEVIKELDYYGILAIPKNYESENIVLYTQQQAVIDVKTHINSQMRDIVKKDKRKAIISTANVPELEQQLDAITANVELQTLVLKEGTEKESSTEASMAIGYISAFTIYLFIFIYGTHVMRGVIEEKTSRIVEVIVTSVRPFQLMMGKIIGIAMVALTQFVIWIVLSFVLIQLVQMVFLENIIQNESQQITTAMQQTNPENVPQISENPIDEISGLISSFNIPLILGCFLFFFIGGYLLYGSLFAAIGSAVDNETDTQQFMLPITIPIILALIVSSVIIQDPEGPLAFWFSVIPLTSPIIMVIRIPFGGVPIWELALSMTVLIASFIATTWLAAKIYRTGILMYGKKITYKELYKWLKYNN